METDVISKPHRLKFDVFLSFRSEDTRYNITERVYDALHRKEIRVFRDDEGMQRGDEINPSLVAAMEDSAASVVVLSPRYADSHWCLDELAMLCHLRASLRRPMIPIFYDVDPSHVRKQNDHFAKYFEILEKRFSEEKIQRWRQAMTLVGNLSGFVCNKDTVDDEMIGLLVKRVLAEVSNSPERVGEYTVGLEQRVDDLMNLVDVKSSSDVQILGLYGMGGIGKTTLTKAFCNKIVKNFEHRVFISKVRERSSENVGLLNLQKTLIKTLLRWVPEVEDVQKGRDMIRESVREKKILVVLDDVDSIDQLNALVGERSWYSEGTLIVITTRDEEILSKLSVTHQYKVRCLTEVQALKLFSYHSLRKENPTENLLELSKKIVQISGLLPLALEVFGSLLYDKKEEKEWQTQLEKLKNTQPGNLQDVLKLSFESLDDEEKKVFLDIACLFLKMEITKEEVVDVLKGCGFNAEAALGALREKSLVKILSDNTLWMHDQIRDMGRQMVLKESREDPGMRSRLWDRGDIMTVLNNMKGTTSVRGIVLDFKKEFVWHPSVVDETTIPIKPFVPMKKLTLLQINHVKLEGDLKLLPFELKWIQWRYCPLKDVPSNFLGGKLAVLDLSESRIRRVQSLRSKRVDEDLKVVNLRGCHSLEAIPDLSNHKAIEKLVFEGCTLLVKVPRSVGNLSRLLQLDFRYCSNLAEFLVDVSGLKHLEKIFLSGCSNLSVLPENIGAMTCLKELFLDRTAIKNLPESIYHLENLEKLSLYGCRSFQELPSCVGALTSLEELDLSDTALQGLPSSIGDLENLQKLHLTHCASLTKIPETINNLASLQELIIDGTAVEELPLNPGSLKCLTELSARQCKWLKQVPSSVGGLNSLLQLQLDITPIETLPEEISHLRFIQKLDLRNCIYLKSIPNSIGDMDTLQSLYLSGSNIEELPEEFGKLENLVLLQMNNCKKLKKLPNSFGNLKSLYHLHMAETLVVELPESFGNLSNLRILNMLKRPLFRSSKTDAPSTSEKTRFVVPDSFSNLLLLEELDARSWGISGKIPDVFEKLSSVKILNLGNNKFHSLPASLKGLTNLRELSLYDCQELTRLPPLPCKLKKLDLANCFSLENISDLSELTILQALNLMNCVKVDDVPGLEKLMALKWLYMSGCNSRCSIAVKKRLSKVALKMLWNLSVPANRIPDWFSQGPVTLSTQRNRELRGIIIAVVVALNQESNDEDQVRDLMGIQAQILKLDRPIYNHTLPLSGVPRTSNDQLHICRYSHNDRMVRVLEGGSGYTIQVIKKMLTKQDAELKMYGIHLVYEGDDDLKGEECVLIETALTISQKLANFFSSFEDGEALQTQGKFGRGRGPFFSNLKGNTSASAMGSSSIDRTMTFENKQDNNEPEEKRAVEQLQKGDLDVELSGGEAFSGGSGNSDSGTNIATVAGKSIATAVNKTYPNNDFYSFRPFGPFPEFPSTATTVYQTYPYDYFHPFQLSEFPSTATTVNISNNDLYAFREFLRNRLTPLTPSECKAKDVIDFLRVRRISGESHARLIAMCEKFGIKPKDNPFRSLAVITYLKEARQMTREAECVLVFSRSDNLDVDETHFIKAILKELHKRKVTPFTYNLSRSEKLDTAMLYRSCVGIMVVSYSFARRSQSLDHMVEFMEHRQANGLVIIPAYLKVTDADIRRFEPAFLQYHNSVHADRVQKWKAAMIEIASTDGNEWTQGTQSMLAEEVVRNACFRLHFENSNNLVRILALLDHPQPSDAEIEGIWGMAGIGKTSIAREIFKILAPQYDVCYFLQDFHKKCQEEGLRQLREDFFCKVFGEEKLRISACDIKQSFMRDWFHNISILVVLDDVSNARDAEYVVGGFGWFSHGHRIILTSRRKQVLLQCKVKGPYELQKLSEFESSRLCEQYLNEENEVILELMSCSSGIPLALNVLGSSVSKQHKVNMKGQLQTLRRNPPTNIQESFQRSFDGLGENEKNIFLDLACFFRGGNKDYVVQILDACGFFTNLGICNLINECLISLLENRIEIPTPYQDIGRFIVHGKDKDPCKRSRLWDSNDVVNVLTKNSGTEAIEGIFLGASDFSCKLSPTVFGKMYRLRLLKFYSSTSGNECKLYLPQGLDTLPNELRLFHWENYPLHYLPHKFNPNNLVELNMSYSDINKLWEGKKNLKKLKKIKLSHSRKLTDILLLSEALNLEHIDLEGCTSLIDGISSISHLTKLVSLNMKECSRLRSLPSMIDLTSLKLLNLSGCSELEDIRDFAPNLEKLYLAESAIREIPFSIENLTELVTLDLENCKRLEKLPMGVTRLKSLVELKLSGCTSLPNFPKLNHEVTDVGL